MNFSEKQKGMGYHMETELSQQILNNKNLNGEQKSEHMAALNYASIVNVAVTIYNHTKKECVGNDAISESQAILKVRELIEEELENIKNANSGQLEYHDLNK